MNSLEFEHLTAKLGFGKYQKLMLAFFSFMCGLLGTVYIRNLIATETVDYKCVHPYLVEWYQPSFQNISNCAVKIQEQFNESHDVTEWAEFRYNITKDDLKLTEIDGIVKCQKWVYSKEVFISTAVTDFNLVCDREWLRHLGRSSLMFGNIIAAFIMGPIGDIYGRRVALIMFVAILLIAGILNSFSLNYAMFLALQIAIGSSWSIVYNIGSIILSEIMPEEWRSQIAIIIPIGSALGKGIATGIVYFIRDWRWFDAVFAIPTLIMLLLLCLMPESPRWLMVKGRTNDVFQYFEKIYKINGIDFSTAWLETQKSVSQFSKSSIKISLEKFEEGNRRSSHVLEVFKNLYVLRSFLILFFTWFAIPAVYFGLSANSTSLDGDLFLNVAGGMLVEIPSCLMIVLLVDRVGRVKIMALSQFLSGVICLCSIFVPHDLVWLINIINILSKFGITISYNCIFLYSAEFFPTNFRSVCMGICCIFNCIGSVVAPFFITLAVTVSYLPLLVMGSIALLSGALFFLMPETKGNILPQTFDDYKQFYN